MITVERLKEVMHYDECTGVFTWLVRPAKNVMAGDEAGNLGKNGYITIGVDKRIYFAHRLAWLYINEIFPLQFIDHINGVRSDNKILNLREANFSQNARNRGAPTNNKSGYKGVSWDKRHKKWRAYCKAGEKLTYLGAFAKAEDASAAYETFAKTNHKEFFHG